MHKTWIIAGLASTLFVTGCQLNAGEQPTNLQKTANHQEQMATRSYYQIAQEDELAEYNHYGFSRFQKQQVQATNNKEYPVIDRSQLADGITRLVLTNPTVEEAATLITDEYVLVAYQSDDDNRALVADQVKRTAVSITPGYYHVFITDEYRLFDELERFEDVTPTSPAYERTIEQMIQEMTQSPQGWYDDEADDNQEIMNEKQRQLRQH
ncbi:YhcN/YlaJ family sporulation lipoprotein [Bacillus solitudinis]|uniref:YhcN/YlaJ family sporulation lipoprotein n=1 Tax=Bacillus solitudinis TaxID=2014074 RepID=UPI000C23429B|nr:YhcN/YlaJ family sporulation lipoprotein [Bacillus solitudinis]